jgi:hypothetical protein
LKSVNLSVVSAFWDLLIKSSILGSWTYSATFSPTGFNFFPLTFKFLVQVQLKGLFLRDYINVIIITIIIIVFCSAGDWPRALLVLGWHSTTELHFQLYCIISFPHSELIFPDVITSGIPSLSDTKFHIFMGLCLD